MTEICGFFSYLSKDNTTDVMLRIHLTSLTLWPDKSCYHEDSFSSVDFKLHLKLVKLLYLMQTLWVAHQNISCKLCSFHFFFFLLLLGENIFNKHMHPTIRGGKFQHRSIRLSDDHGPLPSCCGKYYIYNFGTRTGALEMRGFYFKKKCSRIILLVQQLSFCKGF